MNSNETSFDTKNMTSDMVAIIFALGSISHWLLFCLMFLLQRLITSVVKVETIV